MVPKNLSNIVIYYWLLLRNTESETCGSCDKYWIKYYHVQYTGCLENRGIYSKMLLVKLLLLLCISQLVVYLQHMIMQVFFLFQSVFCLDTFEKTFIRAKTWQHAFQLSDNCSVEGWGWGHLTPGMWAGCRAVHPGQHTVWNISLKLPWYILTLSFRLKFSTKYQQSWWQVHCC